MTVGLSVQMGRGRVVHVDVVAEVLGERCGEPQQAGLGPVGHWLSGWGRAGTVYG
ncbi:hypothetical protein [Streptomyces sp. NPDC058240]|uniref:hypothetical protein n=1 Tax=Streptomyces sp. NPDC058240 TaxID=3346396 RepID=UPI0036E3F612